MAFSMDSYFVQLPTNAPIPRVSWAFEMRKPFYIDQGEEHPLIDCLTDEEAEDQIHFRVD